MTDIMGESPDTIHGRMKEGAHLAGYSLQRSIENLRWLLEDSRFEQLAPSYRNVNDFLRDTQDAFDLVNIKPVERKQIAALVKELQPKASQRAIADMVRVSKETIARDLGQREIGTNVPDDERTHGGNNGETGTNVPPAIPPDDYDPVEKEQIKQKREARRREVIDNLTSQESLSAKEIKGVYDVIVIDPPWPIKKIDRDVAPNQVEFEYPTMTVNEVMGLEIPAADGCHLFLWTTQKYLPDAFKILNFWGFKYIMTFVWHKPGGFQPFGLPQYNCEFALYARRGSVQFIDLSDFMACFDAPRTGHSEKPAEFYEVIQRVTAGRRLDMFNRRHIDGFDGWGKESPDEG
jgi:N6-adenosine-specific RNA methylase IME4